VVPSFIELPGNRTLRDAVARPPADDRSNDPAHLTESCLRPSPGYGNIRWRDQAEGENEMTNGIRWTSNEDDRLKSMAIAGHTVDEIAVVLHRSVSAVYARSLRFGFSLRQMDRRPRAPNRPLSKW
jgi:hypothetical protein